MNDINIKPSCDRKTRAYKNEKNTFGLLPGPNGSCPCATTGEGGCWNKPVGHRLHTCYVDSTMNCYHGVKGVLRHNTKLLMGATQQTMFHLLHHEFDRFNTKHDSLINTDMWRRNPAYRLHWSGDIFSLAYAQALRDAMSFFPHIKFWCYTRSLFAVPVLCDVPNLSLYISADPCNLKQAAVCYDQYKSRGNNLNIAYMAGEDTFVEKAKYATGIKSRRILGMKLTPCPADAGKMQVDGACNKCRMCINGQKSIWFAT